ncbi:MAG: hypothetical protein H0T79_14670 [Deltaproteobacteria bacterium]|nr:hypothetical protein [Deltaproteobacteria bacterium]
MQRWRFPLWLVAGFAGLAGLGLVGSPAAHADPKAERTAVIAVELGAGIPEFMRAKTSARTQDGLTAAGFEVVTLDQVKTKLAALRVKAQAERVKRGPRVATATPAGPAGGAIRVGIVPSVVVNLDAARVDALTQELAEALASELTVEAVGGLEVRRWLPSDGLPADCVATPSCTADVARRLNANQLLFVVMVGTGNALQVDTTWIEPATGRTATRAPIDVANMNEAKTRFAAVARQLLPDAPVRPKAGAGGGNGSFGGRMTDEVPRHFTTPAKITGAIAVVGLGVGIALGVRTRGKYGDCDSAPGSCTQSDRDSIRNSGLAADAGFLVAAAGAIATGILFATSGESARLVVATTIENGNPSGASVMFSGRF